MLLSLLCFISQPPTKLTWLVNGEPAESKWLVKKVAGPKRSDGLESGYASLSFYSKRDHYHNGLLKLRCLSIIVQTYNVHSEEVVIGDNSKYQHSPQLGRRLPDGRPLLSSYWYSFLSCPVAESVAKGVPIITGMKSTGYRVGDYVNLTCTSRAKTPPKLSFIVNDLEVRTTLAGHTREQNHLNWYKWVVLIRRWGELSTFGLPT